MKTLLIAAALITPLFATHAHAGDDAMLSEARAIPDAWEKAALEDFDKRAAAGESPAQLEKGEAVGNEYRYVKALPVQPLCLNCHGSADQISPAVKAVLGEHYPNDRATGYAVGQIRGVISVRKPL